MKMPQSLSVKIFFILNFFEFILFDLKVFSNIILTCQLRERPSFKLAVFSPVIGTPPAQDSSTCEDHKECDEQDGVCIGQVQFKKGEIKASFKVRAEVVQKQDEKEPAEKGEKQIDDFSGLRLFAVDDHGFSLQVEPAVGTLPGCELVLIFPEYF